MLRRRQGFSFLCLAACCIPGVPVWADDQAKTQSNDLFLFQWDHGCSAPDPDEAFDEATFASDAEDYISCIEDAKDAAIEQFNPSPEIEAALDEMVESGRAEMEGAAADLAEEMEIERESIECEESWFCW